MKKPIMFTILTLATITNSFCQEPDSASQSSTQTSSINTNSLLGKFGYRYDLLFNFKFQPLTSKTDTSQNISSNAFGNNNSFNALYGFAVEDALKYRYGVLFNISDKTAVSGNADIGNKLLLPEQRGFIINTFYSERRSQDFDVLYMEWSKHYR